jgi:hypothetical protein
VTEPTTPERITLLVRDFMNGLRDHIKAQAEGDPEILIERVFAAISALGAGILLVIPASKRGEQLVVALIGFALKYLRSKGAADARD